jgi:hypothetical protein
MTQVCPAKQACAQAPQLAWAFIRSAHTPLQSLVFAGQVQFPLLQTRFPAQTWAQNPQLVLLVIRSTQALPHMARPAPHEGEHVPELQT